MECGGKMKMKSGGKWIQSAIKNPGSFTKQAQSAGMSVPAFKNKVLANKEDYSTTTVRRANLANTLSKMRKGQGGMDFKDPMGPDRMMAEESMAPVTEPTSSLDSGIELLDPTLSEANSTIASLEKQAERDNVRAYQRMLNQKYGAGLSEDGAWGPKTQAAYEKFILNKSASKPKATESKESAYWDRSSKEKFNVPTNIMPTTSRPSLSTYLNAVPQNNKGFDKAVGDLRRMPVSGYGPYAPPVKETQTVAQARQSLSSSPLYKAATKTKTPSLSSFYINKTGSTGSPIKIR